jgi:hypothetical protein
MPEARGFEGEPMSDSRTIFWLVCSPLLAGLAHPDISPARTTYGGGLASPDQASAQIEMSSEEVILTLGREFLKVKATFHMKNTGEALRFKEGFPQGQTADAFKDFQIRVNGKKLDYQIVDLLAGKTGEGRAAEKPSRDYWFIWENSYGKEARVTSEVAYSVGHQGFTGYVLHTGAAWKGVIGKAVIILNFEGGLTPGHLLSISRPDAAVIERNRVVWSFASLEPTNQDDILISFDRTRDYKEAQAEYARGPKRWKDSLQLLSRLRMHDRKAYWATARKIFEIGRRRGDEWIIPGAGSEHPDNIPTYHQKSFTDLFEEALRHAEKEPEALALLPLATDFVALLLDKKVLIDNAPSGGIVLMDISGASGFGEAAVLRLRESVRRARELKAR